MTIEARELTTEARELTVEAREVTVEALGEAIASRTSTLRSRGSEVDPLNPRSASLRLHHALSVDRRASRRDRVVRRGQLAIRPDDRYDSLGMRRAIRDDRYPRNDESLVTSDWRLTRSDRSVPIRASRVDRRDEGVEFRKLCRVAGAERRAGHTAGVNRRVPRDDLTSLGANRDDESRARSFERGNTRCFARLSMDRTRRRSRLGRRSLRSRASIVTVCGAIVETWASIVETWASIVTRSEVPERNSVPPDVPRAVFRARPHTRKIRCESRFPRRSGARMAQYYPLCLDA